MASILVAALAAGGPVTLCLAQPGSSREPIALYSVAASPDPIEAQSAENARQQRISQLQDATQEKPGDFSAKAHLLLKTETRPVVGDARPFALIPDAAQRNGQWRGERGLHVWRRGSRGAPSSARIALGSPRRREAVPALRLR
jgi:hypothetical protein